MNKNISLLAFRITPTFFVVDDSTYNGVFSENPIQALYNCGFGEKPAFDECGLFLYSITQKFFSELTRVEGLEIYREKSVVPLSEDLVKDFIENSPFCLGSEFISKEWIENLWTKLNEKFCDEIKNYSGTVALYLAEKSQNLKVAEKIFFHLVENKENQDFPFAFLATYSTKNEKGDVIHVPLKYALTEFKKNRDKILDLLSCLNKAGEKNLLIESFIENGEMFHPLKLKTAEAYSILKSIPEIEETGIVCRIPDWWKKNKQNISMNVKLGEKQKSLLGLDTIIEMQGFLEVDGVAFTKKEVQMLLKQTEGLSLIKGKWVEVNHQRLESLLNQFEKYSGEISFFDALKMTNNISTKSELKNIDGSIVVTNGQWLKSVFENMRHPQNYEMPKNFNATLRPYQTNGFNWLKNMNDCGFGSCLADDMGLGKTVQVIAFLQSVYEQKPYSKNLLIIPASLIGNWMKECEKFAPQLPLKVFHKSALQNPDDLEISFLNITTYSMIGRLENLQTVDWDTIILDEAQAIKNPGSKQTKNIKSLQSKNRIALTGTPVENSLDNLWSIYDFLNKGLLGSSAEFKRFSKSLKDNPSGYGKLKKMISPFMLRRLKSDKSIISDLPEKNEIKDYIGFSKKQKVLYKRFVDDLEKQLKLKTENNIERKGLVLSSLSKLKQLCNHPDQFLGGETYAESDSGKFEMLRELCETIYEKRERVLVFTQFKEITNKLDDFLFDVFGIRGFVLHGGTSVKKRNEMVEQFQSERYIPYMVISVKAGGTGLTLTNANHVIHFDRWWNPAVENQATDRAYRIGQTKDIMVHKFICQGTIEEKIDEVIDAKKNLSDNVISENSGEGWITEMDNDELLNLLKLEA